MNYYRTLGIPPAATADEVRQAYLALAKMHHPDKNKSPGATATMAEINLAYETLCDDQRRKEYDLENGIANKDVMAQHANENEGIKQEPSRPFGKCVNCNFVDNSGVFVCSVCGYTFDPEAGNRKVDRYDNDDEISDKDLDAEEHDASQDNLSEIIRCPQCNEINKYSPRGSCWQCGLVFEIDEVA